MATEATLQPESVFQYLPSLHEHQNRTLHQYSSSKLEETGLPQGFPSHIESPLAWEGWEMQKREEEWTVKLSFDDVSSIEETLANFKASKIPWKDLSPKTFIVSQSLRDILTNLTNEILGAPGFVLIRGLDSTRYSVEDCVIIQAGLTSYVGSKRGYNGPSGADVLAHVRDLRTFYPADDIISPTFTNKAMTMHTDLGDIISLFTVSRGSEGGSFRLASSSNVYNKLAATNATVLRTLSKDFVFDPLHPEVSAYKKPLLHYHDGNIILQSFRRPFTGFGNTKRSTELPPLLQAQMVALDELYFQAMKESFTIDFDNGDLLLFHNMTLLHSRDAYKADESNPRHLLKMFVRNERLGWKIPKVLQDQWELLYGNRTNPRREDFPVDLPIHGKRAPFSGWTQNG